jgi:predicted carbohydrate-binding protein with CBM5 and CBM33 domain
MKYHPRIFAAGDVIDWDEQKQAIKYVAHAKVVVDNVISVLKDRQPNALYKGCYEAIVIANGKVCGIQFARKAVILNLNYRAGEARTIASGDPMFNWGTCLHPLRRRGR